jgi:hypothetical protein
MPQVPQTALLPDVQAANVPTPPVRVSPPPEAFGTNVAQAIKGLGATEESVGNELFSRAVAMQQLRNESEATERAADFTLKSSDLYTQFESTKRGLSAVQGEADHRQAQNDLRTSIRDSVSNPMAQKIYDSKTFGEFNRAVFAGARHAAAENRVATSNAIQSQINASVDSAGYAKSPEELSRKLGEIDSATRDFTQFDGTLDDSARAQLSFKYQSKARANYIDSLMRTSPVEARKELDKAIEAGQLHGQDRDRLEARVHSQLMSTGSSHFVDQNEQDFRNPEGFLARRGNVRAQGIDYTFGQNLVAAITNYERATGKSAHIESLVRTTEEQARIFAKNAAEPGGVEAHPAAQPGTSRHEFGRAADVDSGFSSWLRQSDAQGKSNAEKFGLEFLPGRTGVNDPNHVQLAGDAPLRRVRTYDINERDYVEGAIGRMRASLPNAPPEMEDRVRREAQSLYRTNLAYDRQQDQANHNTILEALNRENPPSTLNDLFKLGPEYSKAWNELPPKDQATMLRTIERDPISDQNEKFRLWGMADHDESKGEFLKEDIQNNPKLSKKDRFSLFQKQQSIARGAEADARIGWAEGQIRHLIPQDILKDREQMNLLRGALKNQMDLYQQVHKAPLKGPELQETAQRLIAEHTQGPDLPYSTPTFGKFDPRNIPAWLSRSTSPLFQTPVPKAEYERIKEDFTKQKNFAPTDPMISQIYIGELYQSLYGNKR